MDFSQIFQALKGTDSGSVRGSSVINDPNTIPSDNSAGNIANNPGASFLNLLNQHSNSRGSDPSSPISNPMASDPANPLGDNSNINNDLTSSFQHGNLRGSDSMNGPESSILDNSDSGSSVLNMLKNNGGNLRGSSFINGAQGSFVYTIIRNWYLLVAVPAMTVTYNVLKALQDKGILDALYKNVKDSIQAIVQASIDCPQKIDDIELFFKCLGW